MAAPHSRKERLQSKKTVSSGWWIEGNQKEEPEDNEGGDVPENWQQPILKRNVYSKFELSLKPLFIFTAR